ncbi:radical SAM family heme chaperone HemW [Candidatus Merdisoma sp. JLR.KK006]|uniref:radical SAM family heme chaperone HemW n=1 Tax=Candidatus Merdisoma sp. JLR.KK006 TaxID=3112626 RepID=UPI002FEEA962
MHENGERQTELEIYIHIPFCVQKCAYCDFLSAPADEMVRGQYIEALKEEILQRKPLGSEYKVTSIFMGGGTPSILEGAQTAGILKKIHDHFTVEADAEITLECNPGTLSEDKLSCYRQSGVNRLSLGLQSADNRELKILGRIHTYEEFLESFSQARKKGFHNLNVDLMSALPGQTRESWQETLHQVIALHPEHISAYSLIIEENTPFYDRYRPGGREEHLLPDEDTERQMYYDTRDILRAAGYERYEISNYAKAGFACRHNLGYWERKDYLGLGLGASSLIKGVRCQNQKKLSAYLAGDYTYEEVQKLTRQEEQEETMFLGLRKAEGVPLTEELLEVYEGTFQRLEQQGLLYREGGRARLTDLGIDVSNYALAEFLQDER